MKKVYIRARLVEQKYEQVNSFCKKRNISREAFLNSAIDFFLEDKKLEGLDAVEEKLASIEAKIRGLKSNNEILAELISFYIRYWLTYTPPLPESEIDDLTVQGYQRHAKFLEQLSEELNEDKSVLEKVLVGF